MRLAGSLSCSLSLLAVLLPLLASCASEPEARAPSQAGPQEPASQEYIVEYEPTGPFWSPWGPTAGAQAVLRPIVSWTGDWSEISTPTYARPVSVTAFERLWFRHSPMMEGKRDGVRYIRWHGPPEIDLEHATVLLVFGGNGWNSWGYYVADVNDDGIRVRVRIQRRSYQTASTSPGGGARAARPWALFVLPRTQLPIVIEENTQSLIGGAPIWKERAQL